MRLSGQDLCAGMVGDEVAELHGELTRLGFTIPEAERRDHIFGVGTAQAVAAFQRAHGRDTEVVNRDTAAALTRAVVEAPESVPVPVPVPVPKEDPSPTSGGSGGITGRVYLECGGPAADIRLRAYRRGFGGTATRLGEEVRTERDGSYEIRYATDGAPVNLELRAVLPRRSDGNEVSEVSLTDTVFAVAPGQVLNVVAPASVRPLGAEYRRLLADVKPHLGERRLGAARETAEQPDLTLLQELTGWDARLVALAASAEHVTAATGVPPTAAYAMLRAGLPDDPVGLAGVSVSAVARALTEAAAAGVVDLTEAERKAALDAFTSFARTARLAAVAPGALSSQGEMLTAAGLSTDAAARFDEIYAANAHRGGDPGELWRQAKAAGLPVDALQRTGKLGYLTLNNAILTKNLQELPGDLGPALVAGRLYRPQAWVQRLTEVAGGGDAALAALVPPAFQRNTTEASVKAYAEDLARKVRVGYPTNVVGNMVASGRLPLGDVDAAVRTDVATFLDRAAGLGLALGRTPVSAMLREHRDQLLAGVPDARAGAVTDSVKTLQRIYQITPSDEAMTVLLDKGFRSAYDVTAMPYGRFLSHHGAAFGSIDEARLVYAKAQQVSSVTFAVVGGARQLDSSPPVFALAGTSAARETAKAELIQHFPTMEQLFGSLDYCECDHCRSVLSPAAYFVDLLHFLDLPADQWQAVLTKWQTDHTAPYPFADAQAWQDFLDQWAIDHPSEPVPDTTLAPYQILTRRRPDLPQLPLTCENTNTAMPYLDVVNEILEFYVAHGRLESGAVRDTGAALSADLLAEPQFLIPKAYEILRTARYPLVLPFDLWLETVRRLFDHFETPLWTVLDAFRRTDALYPMGAEPYGQAAVAIERLGLSPAEYTLLTDPDPVWHQLYGYPAAAEAQAQTELSNAKNLARRLGVTYHELLDLVTTGFVNPQLARIAALPKLGLSISDVLRYQGVPGHAPFSPAEKAAFKTALKAALDPIGLNALADLWDADDLRQILVLADPDAGCGFDTTTLQYADGTPADAVAFLTLNYLVRLWRRLGWSLAETDRALQVFLPTDPDPRTSATLGRAMGSALLGLARLDVLRPDLKGGRVELLELWSDLTETRYAELFLVPGTPAIDPVFDQPLGRYLEYLDGGSYRPNTWDPGRPERPVLGNVGLVNHVGTVQAALQLSADDVGRILSDAGTTLEAAPLDLATVSLLHRYGVLARGLRLPVADLIALRQLSGLDPFARPQPQPVATLAEDHAQTTVRFVEAVLAVRDADLSVAEVDYLLRHRYDPAGPYLIAAAAPLALVRTLDAEIVRIRTEHADPVDVSALSDEELRQKMALVQAADAVDRFFGMWTGTITYDAVTIDVDEVDQLDPAAVATEPAVTLIYDPVRLEQHLVYQGVLVEGKKVRLIEAYPEEGRERYKALLDEVQRTAREFFDLNLLTPVGFLDRDFDYDRFFRPLRPRATEAELQDRLTKERELLVAAFLPFLRDRLIDQAVLSTVGAEFPDATVLVTALVTESALLADRRRPEEALLSAYRAAGDRGLTETADPAAQTAGVEVYLEVATAGSYRFFVSCELAGTAVDLRFDHLTDAPLLVTTAADGEEPSTAVELSPGTMYHLRLDATATSGGAIALLVQGENLPKGPVDRLTSHPGDAVERVRRAHVLLDKAVRLAAAAELTEPELLYLLTHPDDFDGLALGKLPVTEAEDTPARATALLGQLRRLLDHAALRSDIGAAPAELTDLFAHARQTYVADLGREGATAALLTDLHARVAVLTRRDTPTVVEAADRLGLAATATVAGDLINAVAPALVNEIGLRRLWTVLTLAGRLGVTASTLATATPTAARPTPDVIVARQLRDAVRAGYDATGWRRVAQPIFDKLRQRRRDALVAWIMHTDGFDRVEQLFEYFLVDPGTEPVVQTSRLRLAISAVQLFIQRCLLSLEPGVHPWVINREHWQWMKRYRVWEANRKIFLWPENWLEPEFRDDKTHLFQALESSLFQGDVTNDLAEGAFFDYLRSLETLARLDIRAMYIEEKVDPVDPAANTLHVVGRTFGSPHQYFYRSYTHSMWTPWVPVTAEIEGDHLVAAVWRERLHLFWVTFVEKAGRGTEPDTPDTPDTRTLALLADEATVNDLRPGRLIDAHLHWIEYFQGEWTDPTSSAPTEPITTEVSTEWSPTCERVHVTHDGDALLVHVYGIYLDVDPGYSVYGEINKAFRVENKNSPPVLDTVLVPPHVPYWTWAPLTVMYVDRITTGPMEGSPPLEHCVMAGILNEFRYDDWTLRTVGNPLTAMDPTLVSPVFYQNNQHTFYVEPTLTEITLYDYDGWVIISVTPHVLLDDDVFWQRRGLSGQVAMAADAIAIDVFASEAKYQIQPRTDWVIKPGAAVVYDGSVILGRPSPAGTSLRDVLPTNGDRVAGRRRRSSQPS